MKLSKKGFTLVELLAVIVILAVVMLVAITAVGPAITNSKKGAFFSSASSVVDAATLYATQNGLTSTRCMSVTKLVEGGYLQKKDSKLEGAVLILIEDNVYKYKLWLINKDFSISNKEISEISDKGDGFDESRNTRIKDKRTTAQPYMFIKYVESETTYYYKNDGSAARAVPPSTAPATSYVINP